MYDIYKIGTTREGLLTGGEWDETSLIAYSPAATLLACVRMDRKYFIIAYVKEVGTANCVTLIATVTFGRFLRGRIGLTWGGHDVKKFHCRGRERKKKELSRIAYTNVLYT